MTELEEQIPFRVPAVVNKEIETRDVVEHAAQAAATRSDNVGPAGPALVCLIRAGRPRHKAIGRTGLPAFCDALAEIDDAFDRITNERVAKPASSPYSR